jgi:hypothetical protein
MKHLPIKGDARGLRINAGALVACFEKEALRIEAYVDTLFSAKAADKQPRLDFLFPRTRSAFALLRPGELDVLGLLEAATLKTLFSKGSRRAATRPLPISPYRRIVVPRRGPCD